MGDVMKGAMPPPAGAPPKQVGMPMPPDMEKNMSVFNPADMAAMKQSGKFSPKMKVREVIDNFLAMNQIDPEGPASQLVELTRKQVQNADPAGKMMNLAGGAEGAAPPPPEAPAPPSGLEGLM